MDEILNLQISEMVDMSFDCSCGRRHNVDIKKIAVGGDTCDNVLQSAGPYKNGKLLLVADNNTFEVSGKKLKELLEANGFSLRSLIFNTPEPLVPDEKAAGRLLIEADEDISLILAVGSGTLNDLAKFISYKIKIPYIIVGTAPSMDGYASTVSPLIVDGMKKTYGAVYPQAIIADMEAMVNSPGEMICAGFGDILGKHTALTDWELSAAINGEPLCATCIKLVRDAMEKCVSNKEGIAARDEKSIGYLTEALILSGIAMGLVGNSRPASGSEHHFAHYWEVQALARGVAHPLHGNSVGVGTVVVSYIYQMVKQKYRLEIKTPEPLFIRSLLKAVGAADNPFDLGIEKRIFTESVLHAKEIRPRYTVLHLAEKLGILEEAAASLTDMFYK